MKYADEHLELLNLWIRQSRSLHWWFPYEGIVLLSERHNILKVDERGNLHSESGQACGYPDGWGVWAWHGVAVPQMVIEAPDKLTPKQILEESNSQVRMVMIERYGFDRFILEAGAKSLDRNGEYELVAIPDREWGSITALKMRCPTTSAVYVHPVEPGLTTVEQALAWKRGASLDEQYGPNVIWEK